MDPSTSAIPIILKIDYCATIRAAPDIPDTADHGDCSTAKNFTPGLRPWQENANSSPYIARTSSSNYPVQPVRTSRPVGKVAGSSPVHPAISLNRTLYFSSSCQSCTVFSFWGELDLQDLDGLFFSFLLHPAYMAPCLQRHTLGWRHSNFAVPITNSTLARCHASPAGGEKVKIFATFLRHQGRGPFPALFITL